MYSHSTSRSDGFLRQVPIVGRVSEQTTLRDCLDAAAAGQGGLVLVSGDAGIGKSTLIEWLVDEARDRRFIAATGYCYDLTMTPPYGPWAAAFTRLAYVDDAGTGASLFTAGVDRAVTTSQFELFAAIHAYLSNATATTPLVLVLEDMHWADPASVELLRFVAREAGSHGLLLVVTYRANDLEPAHQLARLLPHMTRESRATRIDLPPLDDDAVRAAIFDRYTLDPSDADRLVTYLQARSGGNPFYLTEVLRTLEHERLLRPAGGVWHVGDLDSAPVPPLVRQVIEGRLATLDDETRRALDVAAVIGQHVPRELWRSLYGSSSEGFADAVERALERQIIDVSPHGNGFDFEHALVRETIHAALPLAVRQELHRQVAEALAIRADPPHNAVAAHFELAGDPRAVDWLIAAGDEALKLYAASDAVAAFTRARDLALQHDIELPLDVYRSRAGAYEILGEFDGARRDLELVLDRARMAGDHTAEWQALADLSLLWTERDYERTGTYSRAALDLARSIDDSSMIAHSLNRVANWHVNTDEAEVALGLHAEALAIFDGLGDRFGMADTLDMLGMANYFSCDTHASAACYERAIPIFRELNERQRLANCLAAMAFNGGDHDASVAAPVYREPSYWVSCAEESLAIARDMGWHNGEAFALFALAGTSSMQGNYGRAIAAAEEMLAIADRIEHRGWQAAGRHLMGTIWLDLRDAARSRAEFERGLAISRASGTHFWTISLLASLTMCCVDEGNLTAADEMLRTVLQPDRPRWSVGQRSCWYAWARLELRRGDPQRALEIIDRMDQPRTDGSPAKDIPHLLALRGEALSRLNRHADAEHMLDAARTLAALFGFRPLLWRIDIIRGDACRASGRREGAELAYRSARATIDEIAATITDKDIRDSFCARAYGLAAVAMNDEAGPTPDTNLSPRELDVLRLLVEGKSDREIAKELFISPRTVMRHVASILTKLDVPSRTAAATAAIRNRLV